MYDLYRRLIERFPDDPVRVVRERRCAVRRRAARLGAAGLDERRHRRRRAAARSSGARRSPIPLSLDGRPRLGGAEPPDGPRDAAVHARGGGDVRGVRLRARPDDAARRRAGRGRAPDRLLPRAARRCSSAAGSCACAARSRATATRRPGWSSTRTRRTRSSASTGSSRVPCPCASGIRLRGLDPAATYRVTTWMDSFAAPGRDRSTAAGDVLMTIGLGIEPPDFPIPAGETPDGDPHGPRRLPGPPVRAEAPLDRHRRCTRMLTP